MEYGQDWRESLCRYATVRKENPFERGGEGVTCMDDSRGQKGMESEANKQTTATAPTDVAVVVIEHEGKWPLTKPDVLSWRQTSTVQLACTVSLCPLLCQPVSVDFHGSFCSRLAAISFRLPPDGHVLRLQVPASLALRLMLEMKRLYQRTIVLFPAL